MCATLAIPEGTCAFDEGTPGRPPPEVSALPNGGTPSDPDTVPPTPAGGTLSVSATEGPAPPVSHPRKSHPGILETLKDRCPACFEESMTGQTTVQCVGAIHLSTADAAPRGFDFHVAG